MNDLNTLFIDAVPQRRRRWRLWLAALSLPVLITGGVMYAVFAGRTYLPIASRAVQLFHARFSASQDKLILAQADSSWLLDGAYENHQEIFARIRRKMGSCSYGKPRSWAVNASPQGVLVTLRYMCQCTNGPMRETFVWRVVDQDVRLMSYRANSPVLLTD